MSKKKLIVFCDGTWNKPDEVEQGRPAATNVAKLFQATCAEDFYGTPQVVHYVIGVGTQVGERVSGGLFGLGISDNIKDGYQFICGNYEPGDEIFLFGFSRGAYTARSLAGLIYNMGILKRQHFDRINMAYDKYRDTSAEWHPNPAKGAKAREFRENYTYGNEKIHFIGVWDTVGALGAPYGLVLGWLSNRIFHTRFHDTKLSPIVEAGYHALATEDRRWPFRPALWQLGPAHDPNNFGEEWFPGAHSDVGGGYADSGLADLALEWMAEKAAQHGMRTDLTLLADPPQTLSERPLSDRPKHDSQTWYYRWATRVFVRWPARLVVDLPGKVFPKWPAWVYATLNQLGLIADQDIAGKIARIQRNGDYFRR